MLIQTEKKIKGIITGFSNFSNEELKLKSDELGLHMPLNLLEQLAICMRNNNKKNVSHDELYFLDSIYTSKIDHPENKIIENFSTDAKYISDTHIDIINKRNELGKDKNSPVTLMSYLSAAGEYLYKSQKKYPLPPNEGISVETNPLIRACSGLTSKTKNSSNSINSFGFSHFGTYLKEKTHIKKPETGDTIALIIPHDGETFSDFQSRCIKFIGNNNLRRMLYNLSVVPENGLTEILIKYPMGIDINVAKYPAGVSEMCYADYAALCSGAVSCLINRSDIQVISAAAKKENIRIFALGSVSSSGIIKISDKDEIIAKIDQGMIRLVTTYLQNRHIIIENDNPNAVVSSLLPQITSLGESRTLLIEDNSDTYYSKGGVITSVSGCSLIENPFSSSMYTVLCSVEKLVCSGVSRNDIVISCDIVFDKCSDPFALNRNSASALGIYRAQTELSLLSSGSKVRFENTESPSLAVYASAKESKKLIPAKFSSSDSNIYLLSPQIKDDGILDFPNYRDMLDYINKLCNDGSILCAHAICENNLQNTINSMCSDHISFNIGENIEIDNLPYLYSIIVETKEKINGIYIGKTCENLADTDFTNSNLLNTYKTNELTEKLISNIYYPIPSVIIAKFGTELSDADIISDMFKDAGASTKIINTSLCRHDFDILSFELRNACICVFIGDKDMISSALKDIRVGYAVNEFQAHDKLIISYGRSASEAVFEHFNQQLPIGEDTKTVLTSSKPICISSTCVTSPFSQIKYLYSCKSYSGKSELICGKSHKSILQASYENNTYFDGFISEDGHCAAFISLLPAENIKSAVEYFK